MKKYFALTSTTLEQKKVRTLKELWEKAQEEGYEGLSIICALSLERDAEQKKFHAIFSSDTQDRHGDVVHQNFDLKSFKKNPVFLDSHNYGSIEHIIGRIDPIAVKEGMLQGDIEFAKMNPKGVLAEQMADAGFLNTTSIGFIPKEFDDQGNPTRSELLEISAVSVPANPDALLEKTSEEEETKEIIADAHAPIVVAVTLPKAVKERAAREVANNTVLTIAAEQRRHLSIIAREVQKIREPGVSKRRVYQAVRALLKETDIAA